jgi:hypothetical protein
MTSLRGLAGTVLIGSVAWASTPFDAPFPRDHQELKKTVSYEQMAAFLKASARPGLITVSEEGKSTQGRSLFLVRLSRGESKAKLRVFYYAQQHGNEVSGKDALLVLIRDIAEHPERLPKDVDLYLMPMVNPDGAEAYRRPNGAGTDLNRDHLLLLQPETRALHQVARRILPHLAVDSHEFTRDGKDYRARGWSCWEAITMDGLNHPLFPGELKEAALARVESARPVLAKAGIPYTRYTVGGLPPDQEIRPSTTEVTDGRNSLGALGALSFIIEAGVRRAQPDPQADLGSRVDAYLRLYWHLLGTPASRQRIRTLSERARTAPLPPFLATNFFWANLGGKVATLQVNEQATGRTLAVPTANFMSDLVVKASVPTPRAYAIDAAAAAPFLRLLESQGLRFEVLTAPRRLQAEPCKLLRFEEAEDPVYARYENRQIVSRGAPVDREFPAGSLLVPLDQPLARLAIIVLEPCMLYGLYADPGFRALALADGTLPVWRVR